MRRSVGWTVIWSVAGLLWVAACGHRPPPAATGTLELVRNALAEGDADALYALASSETKAVYGVEGVREMVAESRDELREAARLLEKAPLQMEVALHFEDGGPVAMIFEDGAFRLDGAILGGTSLSSPEGAVLALRAALERRSLPGLLRALTTERRRALLAEMDALAEAARDPLDYDVKITGDKAVVRLPGRTVVFLERESDEWRVVDVAEDTRR
jgi:hypothetical protein